MRAISLNFRSTSATLLRSVGRNRMCDAERVLGNFSVASTSEKGVCRNCIDDAEIIIIIMINNNNNNSVVESMLIYYIRRRRKKY